jgi:hypothetical protein
MVVNLERRHEGGWLIERGQWQRRLDKISVTDNGSSDEDHY